MSGSARVVLRVIVKDLVLRGASTVKVRSLYGEETVALDDYHVSSLRLVVQPLGYADVIGVDAGDVSIAPLPWSSYCRWHDGPLDRRGDPESRIYCEALSDGYCRQHKRSQRAVYEACVSQSGSRSLEACRLLDRTVKAEYSLYLVQLGGRVKVGITRSWRLLDRVAEQPHSLATEIAVFDSAYEARMAEIELSSGGVASQRGPSAKLAGGSNPSLLLSASIKASEILGVEWRRRFFRVVRPPEALSAKRIPAPVISGERVSILGYWGGYFLIRSSRGLVGVSDKELMHRDSLIVSLGERI